MKKGFLQITPLAPLSMVSSVPGSFYRTSREPSKEMLYGMLENILGWHYSPEIRKEAIKYLKKSKKDDWNELKAESGFRPLIQKYVHILGLFMRPATTSYIDLWTQHQKHNDKRHFDGVRNYDWRLAREIHIAPDDKAKEQIMKEKGSHFPNYYQSPTRREFVIVKGDYVYDIEVDEEFSELLLKKIAEPESVPYLGTSEGWVDVKIELL